MEILLNKPGEKVIMLGNEAIVRGALEAGVQFVATYPGTPASEIGNIFYQLSQNKEFGGYFEFSVNEKLALEAGIGASYSGLKTLVAMKNFGLNVASDALLPFVYTGTKGPTVIMTADDPSCHSSAQSEENTRAFATLAHIPILEPSDAQECKDFIKLAFRVSEKYNIPVMVRTTTRVSHQKMLVKLGSLPAEKQAVSGNFIKDTNRFVTLPPRVLGMKKELLDKILKIKTLGETSPINQIIRGPASNIGVITSGISYLYVMEAMERLGVSLPVFKVGFFYPLPEKKIQLFLKNLKKVLIVEELEPYLEKEIKALVQKTNCRVQVFGKDLTPEVGELKPEIVASALAKFANKKYQIPDAKYQIPTLKRSPVLCPGCPYWLVISGVKKAVDMTKDDEGFVPLLYGPNAVFRMDIFQSIGIFDERFEWSVDDLDFAWRIKLNGLSSITLKRIRTCHLFGKTREHNMKQWNYISTLNKEKFYDKHGYRSYRNIRGEYKKWHRYFQCYKT